MQTVSKDKPFVRKDLHLLIKAITSAWITKKYYPVLNVTRDYRSFTLIMKYNQPSYNISGDNVRSIIPITFTTQLSTYYNNTNNIYWLNVQTTTQFSMARVDRNEWILFNIQQIGKY